MATFYKQACPLCDTEAEYGFVDFRNRKYFECSKCGFFQITKWAEAALPEMGQAYKAHCASIAASAPEGQMLVLRRAEAQYREKHGSEMQATLEQKTELPLSCA